MTQTRPEPKVIIIPAKEESPQDQEKKKNLRVAAYCRVSTKKDEQLGSYENQKAYYTEKIMANPNWTMADIFADEGITGTSACKRKNFLRMIRQCRKGKIDMILAKSVSRFARNTVDCLYYTRALKELGIAVIFEKENINSLEEDSELRITLSGAFAQSESESISANVTWGKRRAMESGKATIQYKYLYGFRRGADDKPEIIPEEAEVVRWIYERYLAGASTRMLRDEQTALKELRATILAENKKHAEADRRIRDAAGMLENAVPHIAEWDETAIRQLVAQVKVLSKNEISVTLKSGIEIRQSISN